MTESFAGIEVQEELSKDELFATYRVSQSDEELLQVRISESLSNSESFRAAFRKDEPSLANLHHSGIPQFRSWGEENGQLYYLTEFPEGQSLAKRMANGGKFSWDEFTDIGWQVASALQAAHNIGLTHGGLYADAVIVSDQLQVKVASFGLFHWIAASEDSQDESLAVRAIQDLKGLGTILSLLASNVSEESETAADAGHVQDMQKVIAELQAPFSDMTARDVQGMLGNMLLQEGGESIDMIDHREGQGLSRRSIVDELFEDSDGNITLVDSATIQKSTPRKQGCLGLFLFGLVIASVLILQAGYRFAA